ncbi:MAG: Protein-L-isoaspartate(D-aspartate) O-methyltransferase:O-methyltransferase, family 3 [Proteobacteria bacterium]|nr:Protein-L-isoaspartate(D-aspartate) O-methyltransferase:O-methyltransferase, family 3 [Pseudomonadota bacterium]
MNPEQARFNMIEQQIRPWQLIDQRVLDCLYVVKREDFVPPAYRALAFADMEIPIGQSQAMLPPRLDARFLQELNLKPDDRVLEIGTGSGYLAALIAASAAEVVTIECVPELALQAQRRLESHGFSNVTVVAGDGLAGWPQGAPYDAIVLAGAVLEVPAALLAQLKVGGRLLAVIGEAPAMQVQRVDCIEMGVFSKVALFETMIPPLVAVKAHHDRRELDIDLS